MSKHENILKMHGRYDNLSKIQTNTGKTNLVDHTGRNRNANTKNINFRALSRFPEPLAGATILKRGI